MHTPNILGRLAITAAMAISGSGCAGRADEKAEVVCKEVKAEIDRAESQLRKPPHTLAFDPIRKKVAQDIKKYLSDEGCNERYDKYRDEFNIICGPFAKNGSEDVFSKVIKDDIYSIGALGGSCRDAEEKYKQLSWLNIYEDQELTAEEYFMGRPNEPIEISSAIKKNQAGQMMAPQENVPANSLLAFKLANDAHINSISAARQVHTILDSNTDGVISSADDIDSNGVIDVSDGQLYRKIIDHLQRKYNQAADMGRVTVSDVIFAMIDLDAAKLPIEQGKTSDFGFKPYFDIKMSEESTVTGHEDNSVVISEGPSLGTTTLGAGAGWGLARLLTANPAGLVLGTIIGGALGAEARSDQVVRNVTDEVTSIEYIEVTSEISENVRVAVMELKDGWKIFIFDASATIKDQTVIETVKAYHNGVLESAKKRVVSHTIANTGLNQNTSGRWAVQAPVQFGSRVAIFQEPGAGAMPEFKGIFEIVDFGHNDRIGRSDDHKILATSHTDQLRYVFENVLSRLPKYAAGIKSFNPVAGMNREVQTINELNILLKTRNGR